MSWRFNHQTKQPKGDKMKALILNFQHFGNKDKSKFFYKFDVYDIEARKVYSQFQNAGFTAIPDGEVPKENDFPRLGDITLIVDEYRDKDGIIRYRPNVQSINSWKKADIR